MPMSDALKDIFAEEAQGIERGEKPRILCDCVGTLGMRIPGEAINLLLMRFLARKAQEGYEVIVFSDAPEDTFARTLKLYAGTRIGKGTLFENFEIRNKSEFDQTDAFMVIDNDHKSHLVNAKHKWDPNNEGVINYMEDYVAANPFVVPSTP